MSYFGIPIRNGLPIGLGSVAPLASGGGSPFSPLSLFSGGAPGAWYDPSDYTTLFQDSAGTTPVTAVEQPVGLMLDKSQGLVLGPELVVNGDFSNGTTGWTPSSAVIVAISAELIVTNVGAAFGTATQAVTTIVGKWYCINASVRIGTASSVNVVARTTPTSGNIASVTSSSAATTVVTLYFTATSTTTYIALVNGNTSGGIGYYDNISVRELAGNHAFQSTSASRPVLSARYNLLTKTEDFSDGVWQKANVTAVNTSATTDPLGGNTADKLYPSSSGANRFIYQVTSGLVSGFYKWSIRVKAAEKNIVYIDFTGAGTTQAFFNLSTGQVGSVAAGYAATITSLGNGWYECSGTNNTATAYSFGGVYGVADANGSTTVTANGTDGIYIWGADLRVANNGITQPAYQRVNTATDYATTGFLPYLKFDGVDDSLSTNSISFTSTDKMSVFAGVRKLGTASSILVELSATVANSGTFSVQSPGASGTDTYLVGSNGSILEAATATGYLPPITNTLTGLCDIIGDRITLRVNGVQAAQNTANQGTGNYGNYPLFIGRRGGSSLPFNGQIYSMIVVGKAVTAGELSSTETYVNQKTGAY